MIRREIVSHPKQALVFSIGSTRYAVDILHLREVGRLPAVESVPDGPDWTVGMIRLHGKPVRVLDLGAMLHAIRGAEAVKPAIGRSWIIVSHAPDGDCHWRVDSVEDIVDYTPSQQVSGSDPNAPDVLDLTGGLAHLLTPEWLCVAPPT